MVTAVHMPDETIGRGVERVAGEVRKQATIGVPRRAIYAKGIPRAAEAIAEALERRIIHERNVPVEDGIGRRVVRQRLFFGPPGTALPAQEPPIDRERLVADRLAAGLTQAKFAALVGDGVTAVAVNRWESGARQVPVGRRADVRALCAALRQWANEELGRTLGEQRTRAALRQADLAAMIGVRQNEISGWESARTIPPDKCDAVRSALAQALTIDDVPTMSAGELKELIDRAGTSQHGLANELGVTHAPVNLWCNGKKPIPRDRAREIRNLLRDRRPAPAPDRAAPVVAPLVAAVRARPGRSRLQITRELKGASPQTVRQAVDRAIAAGDVHYAATRYSNGQDARTSSYPGLYPGRAPATTTDRVAELVESVTELVRRCPGRPRSTVASDLRCNEKIALKAIERAINEERVLVAPNATTDRSGRSRVHEGLYVERPKPLRSIDGAKLSDALRNHDFHRGLFAAALGVTPDTVRLWERAGVPPAHTAAIMRTLAQGPPRADVRGRVIDLVGEVPGISRARTFARLTGPERQHFQETLDSALSTGLIHERVSGSGQLGFYLGHAPDDWAPGPEIPWRELKDRRQRAGYATHRALARVMPGVWPAMISKWERGLLSMPAGRRAQLHRALARRAPDEAEADAPRIRSEELMAFRRQHDLSNLEFGILLGVSRSTIDRWERGAEMSAADHDRVRAFLDHPRSLRPPAASRFAKRLRSELDRTGLTQRKLARGVDVSDSLVSQWLRGQRADPLQERRALDYLSRF